MDKRTIEVHCCHGCSVPSEGVRQASRKNVTLTLVYQFPLVSFSASTRVELENRSTLGRFYRFVDIDLIEISNDPRTDPRPL